MKAKLLGLFLTGVAMYFGTAFAAGPMKDIELNPEKKADEGYWMSVDAIGQNGLGTVTFQYSVDALVTLRLFDLSGREVDPGTSGLATAGRDYQSEVDFSNFKPGIYFAQLTSNGGPTVLTKFVISE